MSQFKILPSEASKKLRNIAKEIDQVLDWDQTDQGPSWWQEVYDMLNQEADDADLQAGNPAAAPTASTSPSPAQALPPLHTLQPSGNKRPAFVPPPLDDLMKARKNVTPVQTGSNKSLAQEDMVHVWSNGGALCGLPGSPSNWPIGHYRVNINESHNATCAKCRAEMKQATVASV